MSDSIKKYYEDIVENNRFPIGFTDISSLVFLGYLVYLGLR